MSKEMREQIDNFKNFLLKENKVHGFGIQVIDGGPNNIDGAVQIDLVNILVNGDEEYEFEIATNLIGDMYITHLSGVGEFKNHLRLDDDEPSESYLELKDFLSVNDVDCVGEKTDIDGFEIEILDFSHNGGKEFGYLNVIINDEEFLLDMEQDATGSKYMEYYFTFSNDEYEDKAKKMGFDLNTSEIQEFFYDWYDVISSEKR
jgi:hypothetical protein